MGDWSDEEIPPEPNPRTSAIWKPEKIKIFKYVDDGLQCEKINMETAERGERDGVNYRSKHAVPSRNVYRHVIRRALSRGMKVNSRKTKLLCVSDAQSFGAEAFLDDGDGSRLSARGPDTMKMLGFHFSDRPNVGAHIEVVRKRFRSRYWILLHLKNAGFN